MLMLYFESLSLLRDYVFTPVRRLVFINCINCKIARSISMRMGEWARKEPIKFWNRSQQKARIQQFYLKGIVGSWPTLLRAILAAESDSFEVPRL